MYVCMYVCTYVCIYVCHVCMYVCTYVCIYIYKPSMTEYSSLIFQLRSNSTRLWLFRKLAAMYFMPSLDISLWCKISCINVVLFLITEPSLEAPVIHIYIYIYVPINYMSRVYRDSTYVQICTNIYIYRKRHTHTHTRTYIYIYRKRHTHTHTHTHTYHQSPSFSHNMSLSHECLKCRVHQSRLVQS